ncbi:MAG TPA: hypothetical protein VNR89_04035 [Roseomonas sp.]|nr:hypothetical protein [Roseomonas sp.]
MGWFSSIFGGGKKKGPSAEELAAQARQQEQERLIAEQRAAMEKQQAALYESQKAFQQTQNTYISKIEDLQTQAAEREAAQYNALIAAQHAASLPSLVQTNNGQEDAPVSEDDALLDSQRKGRRALRIDLQTTAPGSGGAGLNVPRG